MSLFPHRRRPRHRSFNYLSSDTHPSYRIPAPAFEVLPPPLPSYSPSFSVHSPSFASSASPTFPPSPYQPYYTHGPPRSASPSPPRHVPLDDDYVVLTLHKDSLHRQESYEFEFLYPYGTIFERGVKVGGLRKDVECQLNVERGKGLVELVFNGVVLDDDARALVDYGIQSGDEIGVRVIDPRDVERERPERTGPMDRARYDDDLLRRDFKRMDLRNGYASSLPDDIARRHNPDLEWELEQERKRDAELAERRKLERERRIREHEEQQRRMREQELAASAERERQMHEEELRAREERARLEREQQVREERAAEQKRQEREERIREAEAARLAEQRAMEAQHRAMEAQRVADQRAAEKEREREREERRVLRERRIREHEATVEAERREAERREADRREARRGRSRSRVRKSHEPDDYDPRQRPEDHYDPRQRRSHEPEERSDRPKTKEELAAEEYRKHFHLRTTPPPPPGAFPTDDYDGSSYTSSPEMDDDSETSYGHSSRRSRYSHRSRSRQRKSPPTDAPPPKEEKQEKQERDNTWALLADPRIFTPPKFQSTSETIATLQAANNSDLYPLVEVFIKSTLNNPPAVRQELRNNDKWKQYAHKLHEAVMVGVLKVDGLDTNGDEDVRRRRKEFVDECEGWLGRLDRLKSDE